MSRWSLPEVLSLWSMVCGPRSMVYGPWSVVRGLRSMVFSLWSLVVSPGTIPIVGKLNAVA